MKHTILQRYTADIARQPVAVTTPVGSTNPSDTPSVAPAVKKETNKRDVAKEKRERERVQRVSKRKKARREDTAEETIAASFVPRSPDPQTSYLAKLALVNKALDKNGFKELRFVDPTSKGMRPLQAWLHNWAAGIDDHGTLISDLIRGLDELVVELAQTNDARLHSFVKFYLC